MPQPVTVHHPPWFYFHFHTLSKISPSHPFFKISLSSPLSNQLSNVPVLRCSQVESCGNSEVHYLFKCANFPPGTLMCERKGNFEMIRLECNTINWRIKYIIIYMSYIQLHIYVMGHSGKIIWLNFMMMLRWVGKRCEGFLGKRYLQLTWLQQQKTLLKKLQNRKTIGSAATIWAISVFRKETLFLHPEIIYL